MNNLLKRIKAGEILISDGAMGTFLFAKGLDAGECPDYWSVSHPKEVREIAESYVNAGSDVIETNSFGANFFKLKNYKHSDKVHEINVAAAKLAKEVMGDKGFVAASVGPTGHIVQDEGGDTTPQALYDAFKEQVIALEKGGADAVCIETMSSVVEAEQAIKATKENTKLVVICTFTFESGNKGFRTMMGVKPGRAAKAAIAAGADIVGANCGNGIRNMIEITREIRATVPNTPILVHSNAGPPIMENGKTVFKETLEYMASYVPELIEAGANIIGGCCGTTPAHITAMSKAAKAVATHV